MSKDSQKKIWVSCDRNWSVKYIDGLFHLYDGEKEKASSRFLYDMIMLANMIILLKSLDIQPKEKIGV